MKKITRRSFMQASGAAIAAGALAACSSSSSSTATTTTTTVVNDDGEEEEVVIETQEVTLVFADGDEGAKEVNNYIIDAFNESQPYYKINVKAGDGSTYSEILQTYLALDEFPDILVTTGIASYARAGILEPMDQDVIDMFISTVEFSGNVYATPQSASTPQGLMYNDAYFTENGLSEPTTWDEFIQLCEDITALGDMDPLVVGGGNLWHLGFLWQCVYTHNVLVEDIDFIEHCYDGSANFSDERWQQAMIDLNEIIGYAQKEWASTEDSFITTYFFSDMCAMMYSGTHMFLTFETTDPTFEYGWCPIPARDGSVNLVGGCGADGWAMSASSVAANPAVKDAFNAFIAFFYENEMYKYYCEAMSVIPATNDGPTLDVAEDYQTALTWSADADFLAYTWNGRVDNSELPSGFRDFCYKTFVEYMQGTRTLESSCTEIQGNFDVAAQSFNPVTGEGVVSVI